MGSRGEDPICLFHMYFHLVIRMHICLFFPHRKEVTSWWSEICDLDPAIQRQFFLSATIFLGQRAYEFSEIWVFHREGDLNVPQAQKIVIVLHEAAKLIASQSGRTKSMCAEKA